MEILVDFGFDELYKNSWSGAIDTLDTIAEHNKEDEFMDLLPDYFTDTPTETEVNDFLWFDSDTIFEALGIEEEES